MTREELKDLIEQAIAGSIDMDWQPSWAADAVLRALDEERLSVFPVHLAFQYQSDLRFPPRSDSIKRRLEFVEQAMKVLG